jgi:hypothetical protein
MAWGAALITGLKSLFEPRRVRVRHDSAREQWSTCDTGIFLIVRILSPGRESRGGWRFRLVMCSLAFLFFDTAPLLSQTPPSVEADKAVVEQILTCLEAGQEAVLFQSKPAQCAAFGNGVKLLPPGAPTNVNIASACNDPDDLRRLPGNVVKLLAKQSSRIDPIGIRVIGAIFCQNLDLMGLDLPYSLVLDKSVFADGILARSFRTHGDLSFDNSLIFGELFLARAHVDGTIFASGSLIQKMRLLDSEVHGSTLLRDSLILELAAFDTVLLSGELSIRNSFFPYLLVQFSKIGGVLDLTGSQARCSYKIRKSEIGDIVAVDAGFGTVEKPTQQTGNGKLTYNWKNPGPGTSALLLAAANGPSASRLALGQICDRSSISYSPGSFLISDTRIKSSLCLRSFHWLQGTQAPISYVTLGDVNVGTAASIDLAQSGVQPGATTEKNHKLEIMGFETGSLFLNFNVASKVQPYGLSLSGLKFEHVYASEVACDYDPNFSDTDTKKAVPIRAGVRNLGNDADPGANSRLPQVHEVMDWLSENSLATTQPFAAFVDVFQKHGEDNDAKALRIAKADAELCLKAQRIFGRFVHWVCGNRKESAAGSQRNDKGSWGLRAIGWGNDFVSVVFGAILWLIADNGYHPEKVGWFVVISIGVFFAYFWSALRTIGLLPKEKTIILPIGIVFLFDRLLPAYQIREDHYNIAKFFKFVPKTGGPYDIKTMRYFGRDFSVIAADEAERLQIERSLDVLKIVGLVLAVFLVAAINAIVSH